MEIKKYPNDNELKELMELMSSINEDLDNDGSIDDYDDRFTDWLERDNKQKTIKIVGERRSKVAIIGGEKIVDLVIDESGDRFAEFLSTDNGDDLNGTEIVDAEWGHNNLDDLIETYEWILEKL